MKKQIQIIFFLLSSFQLIAQDAIKYDCKKIDNKPVNVIVTPAAKPLKYQGQDVFINKYEISINSVSISKFFLYKYNNKLYILDGANTKLNHTTDQALFSLPQANYYPVKLTGIFSKMDMMLDKFYSINDEDFYIYKNTTPSGTPYTITKLIFDKRMIISELEIISTKGSCTCTKKRIIIKLK